MYRVFVLLVLFCSSCNSSSSKPDLVLSKSLMGYGEITGITFNKSVDQKFITSVEISYKKGFEIFIPLEPVPYSKGQYNVLESDDFMYYSDWESRLKEMKSSIQILGKEYILTFHKEK